MQSKLSDLVDNLSEINNNVCKTCMEQQNIKSECEFIGLNNRLNYRCKECKGKFAKPINVLIKKFPSVYQFCDDDLNKFVLLLREGVYSYECTDSWEKFNETSLPPKKAFCSKLNLEDITDKDYNHTQKVWRMFRRKNIGKYHDLYVLCVTLLLADVFDKCRDKCICHFLSAPGLAWQACLKKQM